MWRGLIFWGLVGLVAIAVLAGLALRPATVIGSSEKSLAYSVRKQAEAPQGACRGENDEFRCLAGGESGKPATYRVSVDDYGCWDAVPAGKGNKGASGDLSGCVTIVDLIRLDD